MPKISELGATIQASAIRKLVPFADAAKERGIKIHHLNIGQPDILTAPEAVDALRKAKMDIVAYTPSNGNLSYRKKLCEYYAKHNISLDPKDIIVTYYKNDLNVLKTSKQLYLNRNSVLNKFNLKKAVSLFGVGKFRLLPR